MGPGPGLATEPAHFYFSNAIDDFNRARKTAWAMQFMFPLMWFVAFLFALMPVKAYEAESFVAEFVLLSAALIMALAKVVRKKDKIAIPSSPLLIIAGGFWLLTLVSAFLSEVFFTSFIYFCFFSAFPLSLILTFFQPEKDQFFKIIGYLLAGFFAALSISSIVQYYIPTLTPGLFVHWPLANPNSLGALLSLGFFGAFGWMLGAPSRLQSNLGLLLSVLIFAAVLTTGSRGAALALCAGFFVFAFLTWPHIKKHCRCVSVFLLLALVVFVVPGLLPVVSLGSPSNLVSRSVGGEVPLLWSRPEIWSSSWEIIRDHFWTGTGIGTFFLYYPEHRGADFITDGLMAHSDPLQFWAELGVLGPVLFYAFIIGAFIRITQVLKQTKAEDAARIHILVPFCALGAMIIHTHVSFNFYVLPILMLTGLGLGYWFYQTQKTLKAPAFILNQKKALFGLASVFGLLVFFSMMQGSYILTQKARAAFLDGDIESFSVYVNRADELSMGLNAQAFVLASTIPIGILEAQREVMPEPQVQALISQTQSLLATAEALNPRLAVIYYHQAQILEGSSQQQRKELLHKAVQIDPLYIKARIKLAKIYKAQGDQDKEYEILKAGIDWPYRDRAAMAFYNQLSFMALKRKDMETHEKSLRKILKLRQIQASNR